MADTKEDEDKDQGCLGSVNKVRKKMGLTFSFTLFAALNIAMLIIGAQTVDKCPLEPMIPIYLIVAGSLSLSLLLVRLVVTHIIVPYLEHQNLLEQVEEGQPSSPNAIAISVILKALGVFDSLASIFSTVWLIVGSIYVYGATAPNHIGEIDIKFCDYTAYMFAFIVITIGYVSLILSIFAAICHCILRSRGEE